MQVLVKVCGIRDIEAAKKAVEAGADFLGFNFVPTSKRYIDSKKAKRIIDQIKGKVQTVGVFQNAAGDYVNELALMLNLDFVQLHGTESLKYCQLMKVPIIKAFSLPAYFSVNKITVTMTRYRDYLYQGSFYLLDRETQGEGEMVDFEKARYLANKFPVFFSGGLTPINVSAAVKKVKPYAIDVAGGIETGGQQDIEKLKLFLKNAKGVLI